MDQSMLTSVQERLGDKVPLSPENLHLTNRYHLLHFRVFPSCCCCCCCCVCVCVGGGGGYLLTSASNTEGVAASSHCSYGFWVVQQDSQRFIFGNGGRLQVDQGFLASDTGLHIWWETMMFILSEGISNQTTKFTTRVLRLCKVHWIQILTVSLKRYFTMFA